LRDIRLGLRVLFQARILGSDVPAPLAASGTCHGLLILCIASIIETPPLNEVKNEVVAFTRDWHGLNELYSGTLLLAYCLFRFHFHLIHLSNDSRKEKEGRREIARYVYITIVQNPLESACRSIGMPVSGGRLYF